MVFLVNTNTSWDEPPRCRHQVTNELAKSHRVFFIERNKVGTPRFELVTERSSLVRITPFWPLGPRVRYRVPVQNELFQRFLFGKIRNMFDTHGIRDVWVINFDHTATQLFRYFDANRVIYYCNDEFIGLGRFDFGWVRAYHTITERSVTRKSALCVAVCENLYSKLAPYNPKTIMLPLGAPSEVESEHRVFINSNKVVDRIRVGYVGFMMKQVFEADWMPDCGSQGNMEFFLIGPSDPTVQALCRGKPFIHFVGPKVGRELYGFLSGMNVCIAPYDWRGLTPTIPNKLWLYLSLGKPVVVTEPPGGALRSLGDGLVYAARCNSDFPAMIEKAFLEDKTDDFERRIRFARENSWEKRMEQMLAALPN